jgi:hypothetical protein
VNEESSQGSVSADTPNRLTPEQKELWDEMRPHFARPSGGPPRLAAPYPRGLSATRIEPRMNGWMRQKYV